MEEQITHRPQWRGKSFAKVKGHAAQEVWPLLADFCNLHKVFPNLETCYQLEGVPGRPGLVRYCASFSINHDESTIKWAKERLLMIDPISRSLRYEIIDSNIGWFKAYVAMMKVVPINDDCCVIEWSFVCDPSEGWRLEDVQTFEVPAQPKWEGKTSAELKSSAQEVWPFLADFCNLDKVCPGIETCYQIEGVAGQPGMLRYCASAATDHDETTLKWAKEKLLATDPIKRCLRYEILENNMGFKSYVAAMQVVPVINDDEGCKIEWSFVCDPIEGWGLEDFQSYLESTLQGMAKNIEDSLVATTGATVPV